MPAFFSLWKWLIIGATIVLLLVTTNLWSYSHGLKVKDGEWQGAQVKRLEQAIKQRDAYNEVVRATLDKQHEKDKTAQVRKEKRDEAIPSVTDGRVCFADWGAVRMFNDALLDKPGSVLDSGGTADSAGAAAITDEEVLLNINENGSRWKECRDKIGAIKQLQDSRRNK